MKLLSLVLRWWPRLAGDPILGHGDMSQPDCQYHFDGRSALPNAPFLQGPALQLEEERRVSSGSGNSLILLPWAWLDLPYDRVWAFCLYGFLAARDTMFPELRGGFSVRTGMRAPCLVLLKNSDFLSLHHKATLEGPHNWPLGANQPSWVEAGEPDGESGRTWLSTGFTVLSDTCSVMFVMSHNLTTRVNVALL